MSQFPHAGKVEWIGLRSARNGPVETTQSAKVVLAGLEGDRRVAAGSRPGKRAVTFIQAEHIPLIASLAHFDGLTPELLRRNVVVSGINLRALRGQQFQIGSAIFKGTESCAPCSKMEKLLGAGGYNAMRGHGGLCAEVLYEGTIGIGDDVQHVPEEPTLL